MSAASSSLWTGRSRGDLVTQQCFFKSDKHLDVHLQKNAGTPDLHLSLGVRDHLRPTTDPRWGNPALASLELEQQDAGVEIEETVWQVLQE